MVNEKVWWKSKSIWGGLVALLAGIGGFVADVPYSEIVSIAGSVLAIYGRFVATAEVVTTTTTTEDI